MTGGNGGGGWRTSSYSGGNGCVEVRFATSSYSSNGACVEVGVARTSSHTTNGSCVEVEGLPEGWVAVRDTERPDEMARFDPASWRAFVLGVKAGEFDLP